VEEEDSYDSVSPEERIVSKIKGLINYDSVDYTINVQNKTNDKECPNAA